MKLTLVLGVGVEACIQLLATEIGIEAAMKLEQNSTGLGFNAQTRECSLTNEAALCLLDSLL